MTGCQERASESRMQIDNRLSIYASEKIRTAGVIVYDLFWFLNYLGLFLSRDGEWYRRLAYLAAV
jgi:hypothetical protein